MFLDRGYDAANEIDGNCETDAFGIDILRQHGGIDANQLPGGVDQCATGVARVNCRVGLYEIFEGRQAEKAAAGRTDDALGDCLAKAIWISDRKDYVADTKLIGPAQRYCGQQP